MELNFHSLSRARTTIPFLDLTINWQPVVAARPRELPVEASLAGTESNYVLHLKEDNGQKGS
jgi:hypothetical protein